MNMQDRTTERHREVPPMKTPLVIKLILAALIFMVVAIYAAILINGQYVNTTNPNDPILRRLGITPRADLIAEEYTKANIEAISDDIRIQMTFHIPALAQIDPERMSELIQDNSKFHYSRSATHTRRNLRSDRHRASRHPYRRKRDKRWRSRRHTSISVCRGQK